MEAARAGGQQLLALSTVLSSVVGSGLVVFFSMQHWSLNSADLPGRKPEGQVTEGFSGFLHPNFLHTKLHPGKEGNFSHAALA